MLETISQAGSGRDQGDGGEGGLIVGDVPGDDGNAEGGGVGSDEEIGEGSGLGATALPIDFVGLGGEKESVFW
jgi:hypothetical protein